jgi:hypothetical protein
MPLPPSMPFFIIIVKIGVIQESESGVDESFLLTKQALGPLNNVDT